MDAPSSGGMALSFPFTSVSNLGSPPHFPLKPSGHPQPLFVPSNTSGLVNMGNLTTDLINGQVVALTPPHKMGGDDLYGQDKCPTTIPNPIRIGTDESDMIMSNPSHSHSNDDELQTPKPDHPSLLSKASHGSLPSPIHHITIETQPGFVPIASFDQSESHNPRTKTEESLSVNVINTNSSRFPLMVTPPSSANSSNGLSAFPNIGNNPLLTQQCHGGHAHTHHATSQVPPFNIFSCNNSQIPPVPISVHPNQNGAPPGPSYQLPSIPPQNPFHQAPLMPQLSSGVDQGMGYDNSDTSNSHNMLIGSSGVPIMLSNLPIQSLNPNDIVQPLSPVNMVIDKKLSCLLIGKLFEQFPGMKEWSSQVLSQHLTTETLTNDESAAKTFLEWFMKKYPNRMSHLEEFSHEILQPILNSGVTLLPVSNVSIMKPEEEAMFMSNDIMMIDQLNGINSIPMGEDAHTIVIKQEGDLHTNGMLIDETGLNLPPQLDGTYMCSPTGTPFPNFIKIEDPECNMNLIMAEGEGNGSTTTATTDTSSPKLERGDELHGRSRTRMNRRRSNGKRGRKRSNGGRKLRKKSKTSSPMSASSPSAKSRSRQSSVSLEQAVITKSKRLRIRRGTSNKKFPRENEQEITYYGCSECDKRYTSRGALREHIQTVHEGQTPYVCEFCGKRFGRRNYLTIHLRIHTGERPYACQVCDKSFTQKGALKRHARLHTGEKPFACPYPGCDRSFSDSGNMRKHMKVHGK